MFRFISALALLSVLASAPVRADAASAVSGSSVLEERFHATLNEVVREVQSAQTPAEKRDILRHFLTRMESGLEKSEGMAFLNEQDRQTLLSLQNRFNGYESELNGEKGMERVADAKLDAFAGFIQQDMEQAPMGGGVYISGGALIIILLLILILA